MQPSGARQRPSDPLGEKSSTIAHNEFDSAHYIAKFDGSKFVGDLKQENPFERDFKPVSVLGEGGFGKVMLCRSKHNGMKRAIKIIAKSDFEGGKCEKEVVILKQLNHPNVVRYFGSYAHKDKVFLVTEYCNGKELLVEISKNGRLTEKQAQKYIKEITEALVYLHNKRIVHRDLKPDNIIIEADTKLVKIIDFGLSKNLFKKNERMTSGVGTYLYSSPEVDKGEYSEKCDIWSMGVILYLMLCGEAPFGGDTTKELMRQKIVGVRFKSYKWDRVSKNAKDFITRCFGKSEKDRMSAWEALNHPWLREEASDTVVLDEVLVGQLYAYSKECKLVNTIKYFVCAVNELQKQETDLVQLFKRIDVDSNGEISKEEMVNAFNENRSVFKSFNINRENVGMLFDKLDLDCSGSIDFLEFIVAIKNLALGMSKKNLKIAFNELCNEEGFLDLESVSMVLGTKLPKEEWLKVIKKYDSDGNGKIDFEEFTNIFKADA